MIALAAAMYLSAGASPDMDHFAQFNDLFSVSIFCDILDYPVNREVLGEALKAEARQIKEASSKPRATDRQLIAVFEASMAKHPFEPLADGGDLSDYFRYMDRMVTTWSPECSAFATHPEFGRYISPSPLQRSGLPYSAVNLYRAGAESGDTEAMLLYADMHDRGFVPDADHSIAFGWRLRAAEAGNADGAVSLAVAYSLGKGTAKDEVQFAKWVVIDATLDEASPIAKHLAKLSPETRREGEALAAEWLATHKPR